MDKNFILGVGCQKGGTSWLRSQLKKSKNVDMGFTSEYHVFDALYVPECERFLSGKLETLQKTSLDLDGLSKKSQLLKHINFYIDTQNYYDYFDYLWYRGGDDLTTVGDISPTYSALPESALRTIKSELEARGFKVKVVFLMRDPIERCWSMARMQRKRLLRKNPNKALTDEQQYLEKLFSTSQCVIRTKYEITVKNLELVFDQGNIFYSCYENLFEDKTINRLKSFLYLANFDPDINHHANVSKKTSSAPEIDEALASKIVNFYRDTYEFCELKFGVKELWGGSKYLW